MIYRDYEVTAQVVSTSVFAMSDVGETTVHKYDVGSDLTGLYLRNVNNPDDTMWVENTVGMLDRKSMHKLVDEALEGRG